MNYVRRKFNVLIGGNAAENIKIELGSVYEDEKLTMKIIGENLLTGLPKIITIIESQIKDALKNSVAMILGIIYIGIFT